MHARPHLLRHWLLLVSMLLLSSACSREAPLHQHTFLGFGTLIEVSLYGTDATTAQRAMAAVEAEFELMHSVWHPWQPGSLGRVNTLLATGEWFSSPSSVLPLLVRARQLSQQSNHLFNPAIGKLVRLWGFDQGERADGPPPPADEIRRLVAAMPRMSDLDIEGIRLRSRNPAVTLDLGAFAKGYGIDLAIDLLREMGIDNAIVNAGGDLRAIGRHGERPWRIGIRNPHKPGVVAAVELGADESIFTSGDYERNFTHAGRRYHHIIDPRTGYPASASASVTVIHTDAATADAAATALFVAGPERWHETARAMGIKYVLLIDTEGNAYMNPAMQQRIHLEQPPQNIFISEPL